MSHKKNKQHLKPQKNAGMVIEDSLERFKRLMDVESFARILEALKQPLLQAVRVNPLKGEVARSLDSWVDRYGWDTEPIPYCDTGWWIKQSEVPVSQTIEHRLGFFYIQDAASMMPVELFDFQNTSRELILDMAASPGGKTTHLVSKSGDKSLVLANDSSQGRITALRLVLQSWGAAGAAVTAFPGERFGSWFPETFDKVLLDAPCSMQNLRTSETHPARPISPKEQAALAVRQERLLVSAFQAVKLGGQIVYSTCTLAPEEDEGVVDGLVKRFAGSVEVVDVSRKLTAGANGLISDGVKDFDAALHNSVRLWPHIYGTSGFFAVRLTKLNPVGVDFQPAPSRQLARTGLVELSSKEITLLGSRFLQLYGFDLRSTLEEQELSLWKRGSAVFTLPEAFLRRFADLPFEAVGLLLGEESGDGFELSHEWVARYSHIFSSGFYILPEENVPAWLHGEDIRGMPFNGYPASSLVVVVDQSRRLLGRGKIQTQRLKNLLPRRLV